MADSPGSRLLIWWLIRIVLILCSCFFLLFGIFVLIASFLQADPFSFIISFFAATLIILISAAILAGLIVRTIKTLRSEKDQDSESEG